MTYLEHTYFKEFEHHLFYNSIRPGKSVGSPRVLDIRALQYLPDCTIKYKLDFSDNWEILPQRKNKTVKPTLLEDFPALFKERLKIKKKKYDHLQELKSILEKDYHTFYDSIPFQ